MTTPSAALVERQPPCECGPIGLARLFASEAFRRGAASVREMVAAELHAKGDVRAADLELQQAAKIKDCVA